MGICLHVLMHRALVSRPAVVYMLLHVHGSDC